LAGDLRRRIQLLLVPFVLLLFANLAIDQYFVQQRNEVRRVVDGRLNPSRLALASLLTALVDQETAERGYIITGQESFLAPYVDGGLRVDARLDELDRLLGHDADLLAGVQRARSRVTAWRQLGAEFELSTKQAGRDAEAAALVATRTGTALFDQARAEIADLQAKVREELAVRERRLEDVRGGGRRPGRGGRLAPFTLGHQAGASIGGCGEGGGGR
jgi:CHASE3 domain sensor protein